MTATTRTRSTMSQGITAAGVRSAAFHVRLPIGFDLHVASMDRTLSKHARLMSRMAARYILGNVDSADYDIMARLQVLEGATGAATGPHAGKWWKQGRRGLKAAQDHYAGTDIDPSWFSTSNTGMISKIFGMVRSEFNKWTRGRQVHFTPEDIVQNGIMGLNKDGMSPSKKGPFCFQMGLENKGVAAGIKSGKDTPQGVAGIAAKFFTQKVSNEFATGERNRATNVTETGESTFNTMPTSVSETKFWDFAASLLKSRSREGRALEQKMRQLAGDSELANALIDTLVAGKNIGSISALSKSLGGSGSGGSVRWVKDTFAPAVQKMVETDRDLLSAFWQETGGVRAAGQRRQANFGRTILDSLVDRRGLIEVHRAMTKAGDKQSADLLRDIQTELLSKFDMDTGTEHAINRLAGLASKGKTWDPALIRNNIFKVANSLGMRLPSGMFASQKTAASAKAMMRFNKLESHLKSKGDKDGLSLLSDFADAIGI